MGAAQPEGKDLGMGEPSGPTAFIDQPRQVSWVWQGDVSMGSW